MSKTAFIKRKRLPTTAYAKLDEMKIEFEKAKDEDSAKEIETVSDNVPILRGKETTRITCNLLSLYVPRGQDNTNVLFHLIYPFISYRDMEDNWYILCVSFDTLFILSVSFKTWCTQIVPNGHIMIITD